MIDDDALAARIALRRSDARTGPHAARAEGIAALVLGELLTAAQAHRAVLFKGENLLLIEQALFDGALEALSQSAARDRVLIALVEKWRDAAGHECHEMSNTQYAHALDQCADDLATVLKDVLPHEAG